MPCPYRNVMGWGLLDKLETQMRDGEPRLNTGQRERIQIRESENS